MTGAGKRFALPRGASFDLRTGQWFIAQPTEARPFFDFLMRTGNREFGVMIGGHNDAYVTIIPAGGEIGQSVACERITQQEYATLLPHLAGPEVVDPDTWILGPGPMIGFTFSSREGVALGPTERGLVLMSGIEKTASGDLIGIDGFDASDCRSALFLWDKLDWPHSSLVDVPISAEAAFLIDAGVIVRTKMQSSGTTHSKRYLIDLHEAAFEQNDKAEPGRWSVGHGASADRPPGDDPMRTGMFQLYDVLAIPDVSVPLEEVLAFREKRRPELLALRTYVDDVYAKLRASPGDAFAIVAAHDGLAQAVAAQRRTMTETGWVQRLTGLAIEAKISDLGNAIGAGAGTYAATGSVPATFAAGLLGLGVKIGAKLGENRKSGPELKYLLSIDQEFGKRTELPGPQSL